jgi:hypothetical protein
MIFKYGAGPASSKSPATDSYARTYSFNIQAAGPPSTTGSQSTPLKPASP